MNKYKFNLKGNLKSFVISFVVLAVIFCLFFFLGGPSLVKALDITGLCVLFGLLILCCYFLNDIGFFNFLSFGFKQMGQMMYSKDINTKYTYVEYKEEQQKLRDKKPHSFYGILLSIAFFIIAFVVLRIIYKSF